MARLHTLLFLCFPPGMGKKSNFYPSSLPKGGHMAARPRGPLGQSPPGTSQPVGWLLGSSPVGDSLLLGSSPGSRRASPRMGSLLGR
jgi:hypothetical protein